MFQISNYEINGKREKFTFAEQGSDEYLTLLAKKEKLLDDLKEQIKKDVEECLK